MLHTYISRTAAVERLVILGITLWNQHEMVGFILLGERMDSLQPQCVIVTASRKGALSEAPLLKAGDMKGLSDRLTLARR